MARQEPREAWGLESSGFFLPAPMKGVCAQGCMWLPQRSLAQFLPLTGDSLPSSILGEQSKIINRAWQSAP